MSSFVSLQQWILKTSYAITPSKPYILSSPETKYKKRKGGRALPDIQIGSFAFIWYHWTQGCCLPCVAVLRTQSTKRGGCWTSFSHWNIIAHTTSPFFRTTKYISLDILVTLYSIFFPMNKDLCPVKSIIMVKGFHFSFQAYAVKVCNKRKSIFCEYNFIQGSFQKSQALF